MKTKIFLIRHAEAEGNLFRIAHGQYNSTITPRGYQQLACVRDRFRSERIDAVYGSDLLRTRITASAVYADKNLPFHPLPLLREVYMGCWEQKTWAEILKMDKQMYDDFNKRPDLWRAEGAETFAFVRDRALQGIRQIAYENPGKTVAATSHGAALRTLLGTLEGLSLREIGATGHGDNTAVSLLEVEGDNIRVVFRDDNSHVPPELSTFRSQSWYKEDAATQPGLWYETTHEDENARSADALYGTERAGRVAFRREGDALSVTEYEIFPEFRGNRYGVQLLGQAVQFARERGLETIRLPGELAPYFEKYGFVSQTENGLEMDIRRIIRPIP